MADNIAKTNEYQFELVYIDWTGLRTQMIVGLLTIFCLCLSNFWFISQEKYFTLTGGDWIDFAFYFVSCLLVAGITFRITGSFGHRNGFGSAIWSALIFAVYPGHALAFLAYVRNDKAIALLFLISVFLLLISKHKGAVAMALGIFAFGIFIFLYHAGNYWDLFSTLKQMLLMGFVLVCIILAIRLVFQTLTWQTAAKLLICVLAFIGPAELIGYPSLLLSAAAAVAISLCLTCLPGIGGTSASINQRLGSLGLVLLVVTALVSEQLFMTYQSQATDLLHHMTTRVCH